MAQKPIQDVDYNQTYTHENEDNPSIQTSKKHKLPRLMTLQTSEVLDSYSIGFAGSGNIYKAIKDFNSEELRGAMYMGLGDVAELGFDVSEFSTSEEQKEKIMRGHIKLQLVKESSLLPAMSLSYGSNLKNDFTSDNGWEYQMNRNQYVFGISKNFSVQNLDFSIHPTLFLLSDKLISVKDIDLENNSGKLIPNWGLGLTWAHSENTMFILEARKTEILNISQLEKNQLAYDSALEGNLGVRFNLKNWLFIDSGVKNIYHQDKKTLETEIHANLSGVIPLRSLLSRSAKK
jgi:hypothetical protein